MSAPFCGGNRQRRLHQRLHETDSSARHSVRDASDMSLPPPFVDIHCHLLPGIDDGAADLATSLAMARMAVGDGTRAIVVTPHQLGNFVANRGNDVRQRTAALQQQLDAAGVSLQILPGADVRIEDGMIESITTGDVLTLADRGRHVLLELPHELYFPLEGLLDRLRAKGIAGILSHPERNAGILQQPNLLYGLVEAGCLMQVTAGSLAGTFGPRCEQLSLWMLNEGLVHFIATDAHSHRSRRPLMSRAFQRLAESHGTTTAVDLCCEHPRLVAMGHRTPSGRRKQKPASGGLRRLFRGRKAS